MTDPTALPTRTKAAETGLTRSALRTVAVILARHEMRNLKRLYDEFEHDILLPLLLGEIALHNIGVLENRGELPDDIDPDDDRDTEIYDCPLRPCNAYSIAAATGLPRETVRRKIGRLVELGWISKRPNGHLYVTTHALAHFGSLLRSRDLPELLQTADRVRFMLDQRDEVPGGK